MAKNHSSSFIVERRIYTNLSDCFYLNKIYNMTNKIYNAAVKHYKNGIQKLYEDKWFQIALRNFKNSKSKEESNLWRNEIFVCMTAYKLSEYDIHAFMGNLRNKSFYKGIGVNIVQKLGTNLYASIKKAVFKGTSIHYKKKSQSISFEDKKANSGIIYNSNGTVKVMGYTLKLKPIREKDYYLQEAMCHKIKYCRIVRKPFKNGYKYFLQIILEGNAPKKFTLGNGKCGVDQGTSTIAYYNNKESNFIVLADGVEKYNKEIKYWATVYERRLRLNNPQCYNNDGTIIKGSKFHYTKNCKKALMKLKNAYRKKSIFIKQSHNKIANQIIQQCDTIIKEPMNFKALQKRSKNLKRQDNSSIITKKDGTSKNIHKYKRKKRFGKSLQNRRPGLLNQTLENKINQYNGVTIEIDIKEYKASQYNHITKEATKPLLSERVKQIGEHKVQRDLYSSYLLYCMEDAKHINFKECEILFEDYLKKQEIVVNKILQDGDKTKNFGIKEF